MNVESIVLVGDFSIGSLESSFQSAFSSIGLPNYSVGLPQLRTELNWPSRNRIMHRVTIHSEFIRRLSARNFNRAVEERIMKCEAPVVLIFKGEFLMPETLYNLRRRGITVVYYYPDNPFPPHASQRPETLAAALETDLYLVWSEALVEKLRDAGVRNPRFLPFGWDPIAFPYQSDRPQGSWPGVLFLGGWDREREEFLEELASHVPLRIYGPGYWGSRTKLHSRLRRCWQGSELRTVNAARCIRESAICINILRTQHIIDGKPDGLIMRHFEVPGSGGFLLSTRGGGATRLFPEGKTGAYFTGMAECLELVKTYIGDSRCRRDLAERAHAEIAMHHKYKDRALEILTLLEECREQGSELANKLPSRWKVSWQS
jgi:spore maturation protein CgeB